MLCSHTVNSCLLLKLRVKADQKMADSEGNGQVIVNGAGVPISSDEIALCRLTIVLIVAAGALIHLNPMKSVHFLTVHVHEYLRQHYSLLPSCIFCF